MNSSVTWEIRVFLSTEALYRQAFREKTVDKVFFRVR